MTDTRAPATAHSAAEELRGLADVIENFFDGTVRPTVDHNEDFLLRGDARQDPYASLIMKCIDLIPGFVTGLRMRAQALSPATPPGVATPPLVA